MLSPACYVEGWVIFTRSEMLKPSFVIKAMEMTEGDE